MIVPYSLNVVKDYAGTIDTPLHILAGHYCVSPELEDLGPDNDAELTSFRIGLDVLSELTSHGKVAKLYLWINDIGISPSDREFFKSNFTLPDVYESAIKEKNMKLSDGQLVVLFESTIRNRASGLIKKIKRERPHQFEEYESNNAELIRCVGPQSCEISEETQKKVYTIRSRSGEPIVVKEGSNPKCNLILATLFDVILSRYGNGQIINIFNSIYSRRIELGQYVYEKLFCKPTFGLNIFCDISGSAFLVLDSSNVNDEKSEVAL